MAKRFFTAWYWRAKAYASGLWAGAGVDGPATGVPVRVSDRGTTAQVAARPATLRIPDRGASVKVTKRESQMTTYTPERVFKRPDDALPYVFDFSEWPLVATDPIASATASASPTGLTVGSPSVPVGGTSVRVVVSGGTAGTTYTLTVLATTTSGSVITGDVYLVVPGV